MIEVEKWYKESSGMSRFAIQDLYGLVYCRSFPEAKPYPLSMEGGEALAWYTTMFFEISRALRGAPDE